MSNSETAQHTQQAQRRPHLEGQLPHIGPGDLPLGFLKLEECRLDRQVLRGQVALASA
jgi:hypothetical protein